MLNLRFFNRTMASKVLREFEIRVFSLENKTYEYDYDLTPPFFQEFDQSILESGSGNCHLSLEKSETMMNLHFNIELSTQLICDVSLEPFTHKISTKKDLVIKFGAEDMELSEDMIVIKRDAPSINVAKFILEYVLLEIPMKKVHPDIENEDRPDIIYSDKDTENKEEDNSDPRWEALKKLK